jgi:tRNA(Ile)-lysidine synthase
MDAVKKGRAHKSTEQKGRKLSRFAQRLFAEWKRLELPTEDEAVVVAVSGGADSMALLLGLEELSGRGLLALALTVAHLDHGLRAEAGASDARWVAERASALDCEVVLGNAAVKVRATETRDNLEQAARRARYEFLGSVAMERKARVVLAAHTLDDQAETVLLRLLRGSGAEGLSGIEPVRMLFDENEVLLARPLLGWARRAETETYCLERGIVPRVDAMNRDERYARVRVRRNLLPLMQTFNGRIVEALARTAQLLREDSAALELAAAELLGQASAQHVDIKSAQQHTLAPLRVDVLKGAPSALRRRALRQWIALGRGDLRRLEMVHLLAVENLVEGERGGRRIELPGGASVKRKRGLLYFDLKKVEKGDAAV